MLQIYPWCGFVWRSTRVRRLARAIFSMRCVTSPSGRGATQGVSALRRGWTPTRWCTTWRNGQPSRRCAGVSVARSSSRCWPSWNRPATPRCNSTSSPRPAGSSTSRKPETRPRTAVRATHLKTVVLASLVVYGLPGFALAQGAPPAAPPPPAAPEATKTEPSWKISGLVYGDYYWLAADHREALEDQNGFWFRRIYLTYDHTFSKAFSARLRLEMNSPGDFSSSERMTPYVKDAWVKWTHGSHAVSFGLAPTPSFEFVESVWGYRSVEKTPLDLLRWDSSRDIGLLAQGALGGRTRYSVQVGNGSGVNGETDRAKAFRGSQCDTRSSRASPSRAMPTCRIARAPPVVYLAGLRRVRATGWPPGAHSSPSSSGGRRREATSTLDLVSVFGARKNSRPSLGVRPRRPQLRSGARRRDDRLPAHERPGRQHAVDRRRRHRARPARVPAATRRNRGLPDADRRVR